jgi:flagellar biosynthesis/type III secretory pathway ATPase
LVDHLQVVDWLGRQPGQQQHIGGDSMAPLLAEQLDMDSREQIAEALTTGVRVSEHRYRWESAQA